MIESIETSQLQEKYISGNFKLIRINTKFPIDKFKQIIDRYILRYGAISKDGYPNYKSIALQYFDEANPFFDSVLSSDYSKSEKKIYYKKNDLALELGSIYSEFASVRLSRGRVIIAEPGFKMKEHVDGAHIHTLHIPITTCDQAGIVIGGETYLMPADGSAYLLNATIPHYAFNQSKTESRMHITFPIGPPSFLNWKRSELESMKSYFEMMNMKIEDFNLKIIDEE